MKGYELIQKISEKEIKENTKIRVCISNKTIDIIEYKNGRLEWRQNGMFNTEYLCKNTVEFELIEENKKIEEFKTEYVTTFVEGEIINKINELVRAVNKLNKESEEK